MDERLERAVEVLESWAEGQLTPWEPDAGICCNLSLVLPGSHVFVASAAKSWPEFSGDPRFPIEHEYASPECAYITKAVPKWGNDAYGQARRRLCQHIADWVRANPEAAAELLEETKPCSITKKLFASVSALLTSLRNVLSIYLTRRGI